MLAQVGFDLDTGADKGGVWHFDSRMSDDSTRELHLSAHPVAATPYRAFAYAEQGAERAHGATMLATMVRRRAG